jgi:hypothetical protein
MKGMMRKKNNYSLILVCLNSILKEELVGLFELEPWVKFRI